eukprot:TRINITY_DN19778_c0_g1_i1.p1 TRINITY_DN19778_c0_g1~~TRINITY_DN19778_c0_g1_i1.p1  ORF type:complete len:483 (+),score=109.82 TRINITY_DN19778_c0_g1_i1:68-1450(+)
MAPVAEGEPAAAVDSAGSRAAATTASAPAAGGGALAPAAKQKTINRLLLGIFAAVLQHVLVLQSDVRLFKAAVGGNEAALSRALSASAALSSVIGLLVNQVGGKLSDSIGRKPFLLLGPLVNMCCASVNILKSDSISLLVSTRILKNVFTTFSGTVMSQAAFQDVATPEESAAIGPKVGIAIGSAVIFGPFVESWCLRLSGNDSRAAFKAIILVGALQMANALSGVSETLGKAALAKLDFESLSKAIGDFNPFGFVKLFRSKNALVRRLYTILTLQLCSDGKVTSDLCQMWCQNNLKWSPTMVRNFISSYGAATILAGECIQKPLLKKLSVFWYSTIGNLGVWLGLTLHGLAERGALMWGGLPFLLPGVNGANSHAVKALAFKHAQKDGFGNGELAAWTANVRTLAHSLDIFLLGMLYARCKERGLHPGAPWMVAGAICGLLPQLLLCNLGPRRLEYDQD